MTRAEHEEYLVRKLTEVLEKLDLQHNMLLGSNISAMPIFEAKIMIKLLKDFDGFYLMGKGVKNG